MDDNLFMKTSDKAQRSAEDWVGGQAGNDIAPGDS
ncbi:hypothetical protein PS691_02560 [Pseudomonas fluorescens]|uniref:Uncharacterized protein n=1 Tax=Pseudomonas fluorescens TaxID=294 RepID=A0A5E7C7J4_PSEFL|nr:hypothetical protein PS691_02560 [Pseudomonas fluorescens]